MSPGAPRPEFNKDHFVCPHCGVDANQAWHDAEIPRGKKDTDLKRSTCRTCGKRTYWVGAELAWPRQRIGRPPSEDLTGDLRDLYVEAQEVAEVSPRAAAALLRLLIEKLLIEIDTDAESDVRLADRINRLASSAEITERTAKALNAVRFGGNDAVHEGRIDPDGKDDLRLVGLLFEIVSRIVEDTLGLPRRLDAFMNAREENQGARRETGK